MSLINLSAHQLRRAAELKDRIEELQAELNRLAGAPAVTAAPFVYRRKMSLAAIEHIRASQLARWARIKAERGTAERKPKRRFSANGRARISAHLAG